MKAEREYKYIPGVSIQEEENLKNHRGTRSNDYKLLMNKFRMVLEEGFFWSVRSEVLEWSSKAIGERNLTCCKMELYKFMESIVW